MPIIKNIQQLTLTPRRKKALKIIEEGLRALDYKKTLSKILSWLKKLTKNKNVYLIGFGKGSSKAAEILEKKIKFKKIYVIDVIGKYFKGTHPLPSRKNIIFTNKVVQEFQNKLTSDDLVIVIVCGGGSALFTLPVVSFTFFKKVEDGILTGRLPINVADFVLIMK